MKEGRKNTPMPPEEQEVTLVVQGDDLPALEFGEGREERLEHTPDGVPKTRDKVVQDKFGIVGRGAGVALESSILGLVQRVEQTRNSRRSLSSAARRSA